MLHYETIHSATLELLKHLASSELTKQDFIDVYELLKHYELSEILDFYMQKYPDYSIFQALLSLTYFDDAESQAMPVMFASESWNEMKEKIRVEVRKYQKNGIIDKNS